MRWEDGEAGGPGAPRAVLESSWREAASFPLDSAPRRNTAAPHTKELALCGSVLLSPLPTFEGCLRSGAPPRPPTWIQVVPKHGSKGSEGSLPVWGEERRHHCHLLRQGSPGQPM